MSNAIIKQQLIDQINALTVDTDFSQADVNYLMNWIIANGDMTGTPRDLIQIRRGNEVDLPNLAQGELAYCFDTGNFFVGGLNGNVKMQGNKDVFINVKDFGAKGDGTTNDTSSITSAIVAASLIGGELIFPSGTYKTDSQTFPINVTVKFINPAKLSINTGQVITFNGQIDAGLFPIISGLGTATGFTKVKELYPKWFGAIGDGVTDDYVSIQAAINATPRGGKLFFSRGNYLSKTGWVITREIVITSGGYTNSALAGLFFDLELRPIGEAGILVDPPSSSTFDHLEISNFYVLNTGASARLLTCNYDGINLRGSVASGKTIIWDAMIKNVMVDGFRTGFRGTQLILPRFYECRAVTNGARGFLLEEFSTGASFIDCYAERNFNFAGFEITGAYYPTFLNCHGDSNKYGWFFTDCVGVNCVGLSSEESGHHAIRIVGAGTSVLVKGLTTVGSGTITDTAFVPTMVYLISGFAEIEGLVETNPYGGSIRQYSVVTEAGSTMHIKSCKELLPYLIVSPIGKTSIDNQFTSSGFPSATGWTLQDVGKIVYNNTATEAGTTPNKYIVYGWRRNTSGNGNVLNTDWLELRALTGN